MSELIVGIIFLFLYFLPSIVVGKKRNATAVFVLNLLLGWTVIGWIVALVWASTNDRPVTVINQNSNKTSASDELEKLNRLRQEGVLSDNEFQEQKKKILSR